VGTCCIGSTVAFGVGVGVGISIGAGVSNSRVYGKGVSGAVDVEGSSGGEAASCSISNGCSGAVVVVAWINIVGFKGSLL